MATCKTTPKAAVAATAADVATVPHVQHLAKLVHAVRHEKVLIDTDLAQLYGVETGALNRTVKRNASRFPADFMFQLTAQEWDDLRCQTGISSAHGGRREVQVNIAIKQLITDDKQRKSKRPIGFFL